jgi:hypothetical protein
MILLAFTGVSVYKLIIGLTLRWDRCKAVRDHNRTSPTVEQCQILKLSYNEFTYKNLLFQKIG